MSESINGPINEPVNRSIRRSLLASSALLSGLLFGVGLAASGMTDAAKVLGFLDIFGDWDSDLLWVMGSAVLTTALSFRFILRRKTPLFTAAFQLPSARVVDKKLLSGAVLFGCGWGLFGYCPGPAIAALVYFEPSTLVFLLTMLLGMFLADKLF